MAFQIRNFDNDTRKLVNRMGNFSVYEYDRDLSVSPSNAMNEYFMARWTLSAVRW